MNNLDTTDGFGSSLTGCSENDCYIKLTGITNPVIFKGEEAVLRILGKGKKACDCIIFTGKEQVIVSLVELKSITIEYTEVVEKFENTIQAVQSILYHHQIPITQMFFILLTKEYYRKPSRLKLLQQYRVNVTGKKIPIISNDCGARLKILIKKNTRRRQ